MTQLEIFMQLLRAFIYGFSVIYIISAIYHTIYILGYIPPRIHNVIIILFVKIMKILIIYTMLFLLLDYHPLFSHNLYEIELDKSLYEVPANHSQNYLEYKLGDLIKQ